jgi:hypothetical protein
MVYDNDKYASDYEKNTVDEAKVRDSLTYQQLTALLSGTTLKRVLTFQTKLNNTSVYCLNSKVHPGVMAVKGEKELCK